MEKSPFLILVGDAIREIRKSRELSQEELASRTGLDRTYIGGIERGERNVSLLNLKKIAEALQVEVSRLVTVERRDK